MAYLITKTAGEKLTIVQDGTINNDTDLTLIGRNYPNFGQIINQNFVAILENFSSGKVPASPLRGQLWYDSKNKKLKLYNGSKFKGLPILDTADTQPLDQAAGDFWFNSSEGKLYFFDGTAYNLIGPQLSGAEKNNRITASVVLDNSSVSHYVLKHRVQQFGGGIDTVAITSADEFTPQSEPGFPVIKRGITFKDADTNGISTDVVLWGTSANALLLNGQSAGNFVIATAASVDNSITIVGTSANIITSGTRIKFTVNNTDEIIRIEKPVGGQAAILPLATGSIDVGSNSLRYQAVYAQTIYSTTNNATYADLAERYKADASYEVGTVLRIGGTEEVTICNTYEDESYAGIVSASPAYAMNSELGPVERCPYIALKGRVPVKIKGPCKKGQILVTSDFPGHAEVRRPGQRPNPLGVVGKALQDFDGEFGIVEVMV